MPARPWPIPGLSRSASLGSSTGMSGRAALARVGLAGSFFECFAGSRGFDAMATIWVESGGEESGGCSSIPPRDAQQTTGKNPSMAALDFAPLLAPGLPPPAAKWNGFAKYNFTGGNNDADQVPLDALVKAATDVLAREGRTLATYGLESGPLGYRPLREFLAQKLKRTAGIACAADEILITSGSLQALDLVNGMLLARGDTVIIEAGNLSGRADPAGHGSASMPSAFRSTARACAWTRSPPRSTTSSAAACGRNTSTPSRPCRIRPARS